MHNRTAWISFLTIIRKESHRFFRLWIQTMLPSVVTSVLYFLIFGGVIGSRITSMGGVSYLEFIVPGLIMMSVINNAYMNVVSSFFGAKFQRHIEEILVSPTPNLVILLGFVGGGILRGLVLGLLITGVAWCFAPMQITHPLLMGLIVFLIAFLFSLAGFINAVFAKTFDDISLVPTFLLTPLTYLGGVFYSIDLLPAFWQKISLFNPIFYMIDAFRFSMLGVSDLPIQNTLILIFGMTATLFVLAYVLLAKGIGIRS
jgi:ABC-2 type transport system permease protein